MKITEDLERVFADFASQTSQLTAEQAQLLLKNFLKNYNTTPEQLQSFLKQQPKEHSIPISIFKTPKLSSLELIVKYFRENKGWRFTEIAKHTNRDPRAIATTYRNAKRKYSKKITHTQSKYHIPLSLLSNRTLSVLENIAYYLAVECKLKLAHIAKLLNKDPRTIWTVVNRAKKKL